MSEFNFPPQGNTDRVSEEVNTANIARFEALVSQNLARPEARFTGRRYLLELESPGYEIAVSRVHEGFDLSRSSIGPLKEIVNQLSNEPWAGKKSHITIGKITVANLATGYRHAYGYDEDFDSFVRSDSRLMADADKAQQVAIAEQQAIDKELEEMTGGADALRRELAKSIEAGRTWHANKMFERDMLFNHFDVESTEFDGLISLIDNAQVKLR